MNIFKRIATLEKQAINAEIWRRLVRDKHNRMADAIQALREENRLLRSSLAPPIPGEITLVIDERIDDMNVLYHLVLPAPDASLASKATKRTLTNAAGEVKEIPLDKLTVDGLTGEIGSRVTGKLTDSNAIGETVKPFDLVIPEPKVTAAPAVGDVAVAVDGPAPDEKPAEASKTTTKVATPGTGAKAGS
ncbi:MAG: hypothetical protein JXB10_09035 [Pirellulales bacterium]|nr:hypothetical protein [Pirellulales bacterium]